MSFFCYLKEPGTQRFRQRKTSLSGRVTSPAGPACCRAPRAGVYDSYPPANIIIDSGPFYLPVIVQYPRWQLTDYWLFPEHGVTDLSITPPDSKLTVRG